MNIERMLFLADQLENPTDPRLAKVTFDMRDFASCPSWPFAKGYVPSSVATECGTAACIGGHACILFGGAAIHDMEARRVLDLNYHQAGMLFYNRCRFIAGKLLPDITREEAAAAVRRMAQMYVDQTLAKLEIQLKAEMEDEEFVAVS